MSKLQINVDEWKDNAQSGELKFHQKDSFRPSGKFDEETIKLFTNFGFSPEQYNGLVIVDAGCGSMLRTKFFKNSYIIAIDPLLDEYKNITWSDLHIAKEQYSVPLEKRLTKLKGIASLVISINVLDHCFNFISCIRNLHYYLKDGGMCFLSFDEHEDGMDDMHPLDLSKETCDGIFKKYGFAIQKFTKSTMVYGGGTSSLNYWLMKESDVVTCDGGEGQGYV